MIEFTRSIFLLHKIAFVFQFKFLSCHNAAIAILSRMPLRRNEFRLFDAVCFGNQNRKLFFHRMFLIQFRVWNWFRPLYRPCLKSVHAKAKMFWHWWYNSPFNISLHYQTINVRWEQMPPKGLHWKVIYTTLLWKSILRFLKESKSIMILSLLINVIMISFYLFTFINGKYCAT